MKKQMRGVGIGFYVLILAIIFVAVYASPSFAAPSSTNDLYGYPFTTALHTF